MEKKAWIKKIKAATTEVGTYNKSFMPVIETLAETLETRDNALEQFKQSGGNPIVTHTNKGGNANLVKNPLLVIVMDLNTQALAYWRDLGLTPAGLKKLKADGLTVQATGGFEALLEKIAT